MASSVGKYVVVLMVGVCLGFGLSAISTQHQASKVQQEEQNAWNAFLDGK